MRLKSLYRIARNKYMRAMKPVEYAKKIGVNMKGRVHIYGNVCFASEPWIITLGDNVHITDGVKFITHDGGTLLFRDQVPDLEVTKPICVGNNVYFGNNVIILPGVTIGNNVVIGTGSVLIDSGIKDEAKIGDLARCSNVRLAENVHVGKACEIIGIEAPVVIMRNTLVGSNVKIVDSNIAELSEIESNKIIVAGKKVN